MKGSQEAEWVVNEIQELMKNEQVALGEIAVLARTGHISTDLERHLQRKGIPYTREGGMKFVDLKHIQLFISFLELLENPQDWLAWEVLLPAIPNIGEHLTQVIIRDLQAKSSPDGPPDTQSLNLNGTGSYAQLVDANLNSFTYSLWVKVRTVQPGAVIYRTSSAGPQSNCSEYVAIDSSGKWSAWGGSAITSSASPSAWTSISPGRSARIRACTRARRGTERSATSSRRSSSG
jgi:hypothetical protein